MKTLDLERSMYALRDPSLAPRLTLAAFGAVWVALAWWLLRAGGLHSAGAWFGWNWKPGDPLRRTCLAAAFSVYNVRILFTEFVFLRRGVSWSEVCTIVPWILCIYLLLSVTGGRNPGAFGLAGGIGLAAFVVGSWMNSYAEYARHVWKLRPVNRGQLYTHGLFRFSRHPNYLGDLISFSGMCLISGVWVSAIIPAAMLGGFVFINIPALDGYLHGKYGAAFEAYARRTRKLIPFVY